MSKLLFNVKRSIERKKTKFKVKRGLAKLKLMYKFS